MALLDPGLVAQLVDLGNTYWGRPTNAWANYQRTQAALQKQQQEEEALRQQQMRQQQMAQMLQSGDPNQVLQQALQQDPSLLLDQKFRGALSTMRTMAPKTEQVKPPKIAPSNLITRVKHRMGAADLLDEIPNDQVDVVADKIGQKVQDLLSSGKASNVDEAIDLAIIEGKQQFLQERTGLQAFNPFSADYELRPQYIPGGEVGGEGIPSGITIKSRKIE